MSIFALKRKPRRFHHIPIYYDENSRQPTGPFEEIRGSFAESSNHLSRRKAKARSWTGNAGILLLLIFVLAMIWYFLNN